MDELVEWCDQNFLEFNVAKTEEIVIDLRRNKSCKVPPVIKEKEVRIAGQYKYLGTVIDDKLEWTANMEACYMKANQRMHFLAEAEELQAQQQRTLPLLSVTGSEHHAVQLVS